jgi:hypothetical protein
MASKKTLHNPIFINNSTDETGQKVSSVYVMHLSKLKREIWSMEWQYYRHRGKLDVKDVIKKFRQMGREIKINYSIQLKQHNVQCVNNEPNKLESNEFEFNDEQNQFIHLESEEEDKYNNYNNDDNYDEN